MAVNPINSDIEHVISKREADTGVSTGIGDLDKVIHGLCPAKLYTVAGFSGIGKTSFLSDLILSAAKEVPAVFYSLDMPVEEVQARMLANLAGINYHRWMSGNNDSGDEKALQKAAKTIRELNPISMDLDAYSVYKPYFLREPDLEVQRASIELSINEHYEQGYRAVFVDHVQKVVWSGKDAGLAENLKTITDVFKKMAVKYNIPIVLLAQMTKDMASIATNRRDPTPLMSDIYGSVFIQANSDVVLLLHRPEHFKQHKDSMEDMLFANRVENDAKIVVGKMRSGPGPCIDVDFHAFAMSWKNKIDGGI